MKHTIIETERLRLREMDISDMKALSSILQDEKVMYAYNGPFNNEETMAWMQKTTSTIQRLWLRFMGRIS